MRIKIPYARAAQTVIIMSALLLLAPTGVYAQRGGGGGGRGGNAGGGQRGAKAGAPIDITGYWVSVVTEDWRFRMVTPPKGDFDSLPISQSGRQIAQTWDPAKDEAAGEQCRSYGAPAIMRMPGRINITWQDDNTMKIETDSGTQTRLFHFGAAAAPEAQRSWQGYSTGQFKAAQGGKEGREAGVSSRGGELIVKTSNLRMGYLRKNGAPYSEKTAVTEYYNTFKEPNGEQWLIITTIVEDPDYLTQPFVTSTNFKKQPDSKGWNPGPCSSR